MTLESLVPPPASHAAFARWDELARRLGVGVPADYRRIVTTYGAGSFDQFLHVMQPKSGFPALRLVSFAEAYRTRLRARPATPYAPDDLLPVARTEDADVISWVMHPRDEPERWTLTIENSSRTAWLPFDGGLEAFLIELYSGRLRMPFFPDDFPAAPPRFHRYPSISSTPLAGGPPDAAGGGSPGTPPGGGEGADDGRSGRADADR